MENEMQGKYRAIQIDGNDNVATATEEIPADGTALVLDKAGQGKSITVVDPIPANHKFAVKDIKAGQQVIKYGQSIGQITEDVRVGNWVHVHNIKSLRGRGRDSE